MPPVPLTGHQHQGGFPPQPLCVGGPALTPVTSEEKMESSCTAGAAGVAFYLRWRDARGR